MGSINAYYTCIHRPSDDRVQELCETVILTSF